MDGASFDSSETDELNDMSRPPKIQMKLHGSHMAGDAPNWPQRQLLVSPQHALELPLFAGQGSNIPLNTPANDLQQSRALQLTSDRFLSDLGTIAQQVNNNEAMQYPTQAKPFESLNAYSQASTEPGERQAVAKQPQDAVRSLPTSLSQHNSINDALHLPGQPQQRVFSSSPQEVTMNQLFQTVAAPQPHNEFVHPLQHQFYRSNQAPSQWDPLSSANSSETVPMCIEFAPAASDSYNAAGGGSMPSSVGLPSLDFPGEWGRGTAASHATAGPQPTHGFFDMDQAMQQSLLQQYNMLVASHLPLSQGHAAQQQQILYHALQQVQQQSPHLASNINSTANVNVSSFVANENSLELSKAAAAAAIARQSSRGLLPPVNPQASGPVEVRVRSRRRYRHESFPCKLYRLLDDAEREGNQHIVSFTLSGTAFKIHNASSFTAQLLPRYFRHGKMASLKRQLSMYGFQRLTSGPELGAFHHALFRKGRPELCLQLKRLSEFEIVSRQDKAAEALPSASIEEKNCCVHVGEELEDDSESRAEAKNRNVSTGRDITVISESKLESDKLATISDKSKSII